MAKTLTEITADIIIAQLSHRDMSSEDIGEALTTTFNVLKNLRDSESQREGSGAQTAPEALAFMESLVKGAALAERKKPQRKSGASRPKEPAATPSAKPAVSFADPLESIQDETIICLECGREFKQISHTHLRAHGLTPKTYRKKYKLPARQALTSKTLSEKRKQKAKEIGLGSRMKESGEPTPETS